MPANCIHTVLEITDIITSCLDSYLSFRIRISRVLHLPADRSSWVLPFYPNLRIAPFILLNFRMVRVFIVVRVIIYEVQPAGYTRHSSIEVTASLITRTIYRSRGTRLPLDRNLDFDGREMSPRKRRKVAKRESQRWGSIRCIQNWHLSTHIKGLSDRSKNSATYSSIDS